MKKIIAILLVLVMILSVASCSEYEPVKSTKEESRVMMTLTADGEEYELRYELYRALFLNFKSEIDGGDPSVWSGEDSLKYIEAINRLIADAAANIFAVMHICETVADYDLYSGKADKRVEEYIKESVEGGSGSLGLGSYEAYLLHLKDQNLNYSVQDLLYRYYIALEEIDRYFMGDTDADSITDDEIDTPHLDAPVQSVRAFYYSDSCKRVLYAYLSELVLENENPKFDINAYHEKMVAAASRGRGDVEVVIAGSAAQDIKTGLFLSRNAYNAYNEDYLKVINDAAFALSDGEVSEIVTVDGTGDSTIDGFYILYGIEKSEEDFLKYYTQIRLAYMNDALGTMLTAKKNELIRSIVFTEDYTTVSHKDISM